MSVSIDLHVKYLFYNNGNKKCQPFFHLVKFAHGIWRAKSYILPSFKVTSSKKKFTNVLSEL